MITLAALVTSLPAVAGITSRQALTALERQYGPGKFDRIVSMRAEHGAPSPREWVVVVFDPQAPTTLRSYWADETRVASKGVNSSFYPNNVPTGFVAAEKVKVESSSAFAIVDNLARKEGVAFNEVSYTLRAIDFTDEPVWILRLIDNRGAIVGRISLSAKNGKVLRRVWMTPSGVQRTGQPFVRDSLAPKPGVGRVLPPVPMTTGGGGVPSRQWDVDEVAPVPGAPSRDPAAGLPPLPKVDITEGVEGFDPNAVTGPAIDEKQPVNPPQVNTGGGGLYEEITPGS